MSANDLEPKLDALFAEPPEKFMEARDALAKALKAAGDKEGVARVKAQHKPSRAAHALNRLAREARPEIEALFEAGRALATGKNFHAALEHQRSALEEVRKKISGPDMPEILGVVRGALVDPALAEQLKLGRFSKVPEVRVGFFGAAPEGAAPVPAPPPKTTPAPAQSRAQEEAEEAERLERHQREVEEAEAQAAALAQQAEGAEKGAAALAAEAQAAQKEAAALTSKAAAAGKEAAAARHRAHEALERVKKVKARK